jgi:TetR/AcrR family transcriptional regulator, regulator of cefoperazone and chloramphenicol sensitivity
MAGYMRRLLVDGGPAGMALYERLFEVTQHRVRAMEEAGVVRPAQDEPVRSAFLLSNDLALLLRQPITQVTRIDPLALEGLARWAAAAFDVYANGLFIPAASPAQAGDMPAMEIEEVRPGDERH